MQVTDTPNITRPAPKPNAAAAYLPEADPEQWLERSAVDAPLWAKVAVWHYGRFPLKRPGRIQRALRKWGARGPRLFVARLAGDIRWIVDMNLLPSYAGYHSAVAVEGADDHMIRAINALVRPGDKVLDVGANRGYFSVLMRRLAGPGGALTAIEPVRLTRSLLAANLRLNRCNDVRIIPAGLSDEDASTEITVNPTALGCSSLHPKESPELATGAVVEQIRLRRLDDVLREEGIGQPDFIKIDVEGHEMAAFRGAEQTLAAQPMVLMEAWPNYASSTGFSLGALERMFHACGRYRFSAVRWADGALKHLPSPLSFDDFQSIASDLVAWIPARHEDRIRNLS